MKQLTAMTLGLIVATTAFEALADSRDRENLASCNTNIEAALGEDTHTRLYGIHHRRDGDRLRLKAFPAAGSSQVLDCWVDDEGGVVLRTLNGVALGTPAYDGEERVTLSE